MGVKRGFVWAFLMLSIVLAVGASAVYYWPEDSGGGKPHAVRGLSLMGAGSDVSAEANGLPIAAQTAASGGVPAAAKTTPSGAAPRNARPPLSLNPRRAVEAAQQSGSPQDALVAAQAIHRCSYLTGSSQMALEKIHERGIRAGRELMSPIEAAERMCQELDDSMKAQYEPMLRRAMEGAVPGAAALWLLTPEAKAIQDASGKRAALELLRRDATQCELLSFNGYKLAAYQYPNEFDANEIAAVYAATAQLYEDKKLKNNSFDKLMKMFTPWYALQIRIGVDEDVVKATTARILNSCV